MSARKRDDREDRDDLGLQEVADALGLHYMTVYRYVRTGRLDGHQVRGQWRVPRAALEHLAPSAPPGRGARTSSARGRDYAQRLVPLIVRGDEAEAWRLVQTALAAAYTPEDLSLDVLAAAMRRVGDDWAAGRLDVAGEHRATVVMYRLVGRLGPRFARPGTPRGTVVLGAPSGDHHGLATALVADPLRGRGFAVVDLGADTPPASWAEAAGASDRLLGVGIVASTPDDDAVAGTVAAVRAARDVPIVLGGVAIRDEAHALALGADVWTRDGRAAVEALAARGS